MKSILEECGNESRRVNCDNECMQLPDEGSNFMQERKKY